MAVKLLALRRSSPCAKCDGVIAAGSRAWWNSDQSNHTCVNCPPEEPVRRSPSSTTVEPSAQTSDVAVPPDGSWLRTLMSTVRSVGVVPVAVRLGSARVVEAVFVAASGVWVVGAVDDAGRIELRDVAQHAKYDWRVFVGGIDRTRHIGEIDWAAREIERRADLRRQAGTAGPSLVHKVLCVPHADPSTSRTPLVHEGVWVIRPEQLVERTTAAGFLDPTTVRRLAAACEQRLGVD